ncbi:P-loop containing nucleoside triphosphate hydrolase protein [Mycena amicta]|nr:P-loop containing nucleoside triphosphate hydrolase protein [Mycena amicta]
MSFPDSDSDLSDLGQTGVGLSDPSIAKGRRAMLDLVNRLQNTGVQLDIDLPRIAVIGSQSAGKSSLIESISGVSLPRASGTCTRCPTECRLSRSNRPWKCTVELRFITDKNGTPLGHARTEPFGDPVSDKADVEERIRRAQRAILNPSKSAQSFLEDARNDDANSQGGHGAMQDEMSFSTNFISLSISGPDLADLSFVDLPGLIASVSRGGSDRDIKMVESLVESYISKPSCVILLTVACETDFENQGAHHLAKIHDPEGKRTVGVLTKPDRYKRNWLPLIRNELEPLENNWYCVKQPSSAELKEGITWTQARDRENDFFTITAPWSGLDSMYHKYLRTPNLVERLSAILSDLISKRLPEIQIELEKSMQLTFQSLQQLPRPPAVDPVAEVAAMLSSFVQDLNQMVEGVPRVDGLIQRIRPAQQEFRRAIQETVPNFCPLEGSPRRANVPEEALKPGPAPDEECGAGETIYVDEVANRANDARARELPGHHPFFVQVSFIKEFTAKWDAPAHLLCRSTSAILGTQIKTLISQHFSAFGQGGLENRIMILLQQHLKKRTDAAHELISTLIKLEMPAPMTLNEHYLADYRQKYLARYRAAREKASNNAFATQIENHQPPSPLASPSTIDSILGQFASIGLSGLKAEDFARLLPTDKMGPALEIMADVRAYFQVAYKRVTDNIPLAIDYELVRGVGRDLLPLLYNNLGVGGKEGDRICRELAQESPSVANKREELTKKMERLETASQELVRIEM